jgi:hypothetical protein
MSDGRAAEGCTEGQGGRGTRNKDRRCVLYLPVSSFLIVLSHAPPLHRAARRRAGHVLRALRLPPSRGDGIEPRSALPLGAAAARRSRARRERRRRRAGDMAASVPRSAWRFPSRLRRSRRRGRCGVLPPSAPPCSSRSCCWRRRTFGNYRRGPSLESGRRPRTAPATHEGQLQLKSTSQQVIESSSHRGACTP